MDNQPMTDEQLAEIVAPPAVRSATIIMTFFSEITDKDEYTSMFDLITGLVQVAVREVAMGALTVQGKMFQQALDGERAAHEQERYASSQNTERLLRDLRMSFETTMDHRAEECERMVRRAVAAERERCAAIAAWYIPPPGGQGM